MKNCCATFSCILCLFALTISPVPLKLLVVFALHLLLSNCLLSAWHVVCTHTHAHSHTGGHTHGTPQAEHRLHIALAHQNAHQICIILRKSNILHKLLVSAPPPLLLQLLLAHATGSPTGRRSTSGWTIVCHSCHGGALVGRIL